MEILYPHSPMATQVKKPHGEKDWDLWTYKKIRFICIGVNNWQLQEVRSIVQEVRRYIKEVHSYYIQEVSSIMQEVRSNIQEVSSIM